MEQQTPTNEIKTWAIVEIMGHQQIAGFAQTVAFGGTIMLRVDAPDLAERTEKINRTFDYERGEYVSADQFHPAEEGFTQYIGMGSIYRLTPCTEETARKAAEKRRVQAARLLNVTPLQPSKALPGYQPDDGDPMDPRDDDEDGF
jgi:hypothetical protein